MKKHLILLSTLLLAVLLLYGCSGKTPSDSSGSSGSSDVSGNPSVSDRTRPHTTLSGTTVPVPPVTDPTETTHTEPPTTTDHSTTQSPQTTKDTPQTTGTTPVTKPPATSVDPPVITTPGTTVSIEVLPEGTLPSVDWPSL